MPGSISWDLVVQEATRLPEEKPGTGGMLKVRPGLGLRCQTHVACFWLMPTGPAGLVLVMKGAPTWGPEALHCSQKHCISISSPYAQLQSTAAGRLHPPAAAENALLLMCEASLLTGA